MSFSPRLEKLAADTVRFLSADAVQKANSGHPGMPMGMADAAVVLWTRFLNVNPEDPDWFDRDRFVLSAGHGSMLLYSLLHLSGFDISIEDIKNFRQWESITPGHPEYGETPGVEVTTGPLGQGISVAVGMALAEDNLAARFNTDTHAPIGHFTYVIASDGDLMEGVSHEACALAGHWGLGRLIVLYDDNGITIDGSTDLAFSENVRQRFAAYGWHTLEVDGHDPDAVADAIETARHETTRPSLIACKTHIGFGSPNKQDTAGVHGSPLGPEELRLTKENLNWPLEPSFLVPDEVKEFFSVVAERGIAKQEEWQHGLADYAEHHPELAKLLDIVLLGDLPEGWDENLPTFSAPIATRAASGKTLDVLKQNIPFLVGGSADLTGSNKTRAKDDVVINRENPGGNYINYGVREHGMAAIMNGMTLHGGLRAFGGTFLVFSDYMRPAVRLAALMDIPTIFVFSHDSIGLGEDGPTHQPVEHLAALRAIPNLYNFRPADGNETVGCWMAALAMKHPSTLLLTRQNLPSMQGIEATSVARGGYVLSDSTEPVTVLIASGSEVEIALEAQRLLSVDGIQTRVVSIPCLDLFEDQPSVYREEVIPSAIPNRVVVEAGVSQGWHRYLGTGGVFVGMNRFGASAPYETLYERFGITADAVVHAVKKQLS